MLRHWPGGTFCTCTFDNCQCCRSYCWAVLGWEVGARPDLLMQEEIARWMTEVFRIHPDHLHSPASYSATKDTLSMVSWEALTLNTYIHNPVEIMLDAGSICWGLLQLEMMIPVEMSPIILTSHSTSCSTLVWPSPVAQQSRLLKRNNSCQL